jgi:adenylylsulfate kinase
MLLDGDNVRHGLCATPAILSPEHGNAFAERFGLGFSALDREENIRRVGAAAGLLVSSGLIVLTAFVSPYRRDRDRVRESLAKQLGQANQFLEVFVDTPLEICEARDPKGLYQQARAGKIAHFTGISDPYEAPLDPELVLAGGKADPATLAALTVAMLEDRGWIPKES